MRTYLLKKDFKMKNNIQSIEVSMAYFNVLLSPLFCPKEREMIKK